VNHFLAKFARKLGKPKARLSEKAMQVLMDYGWPGNVRELENIIQRLVIMIEGDVIDVPDLPSLMRFSALRGVSSKRTLAEVEAEHILCVLSSVNGNKTQAAKILGITRKTLREKLNKIRSTN
jgi:DNA-binding NtrC family response regulator